MNRRAFLTTTAAVAGAYAAPESTPITEADATTVVAKTTSGEWTAESATQACLEAIHRHDSKVHAVLELNPDALDIARALDRERKTRGPLHGVPVLLKDNIDTGDRMKTTAGSLALVDAPTPKDAPLIARLRAAGAVILGKTNLSEWANFRSTHSTSGWSGRGGLTRNPYALDRNPCGSSSGSGVAVSAHFVPLAVGTETDGSVVCPSSMNGIVGIKPTLGLISGRGIIPIAHSQDTAGPMARTVRDAALLLSVLAEKPTDYTQFCKNDGLHGVRLGVARQYFNINDTVHKIMEDCIALMRSAGAEIVDPVEFRHFETWRDSELNVLLYEFKADLTAYLTARGGNLRSLADVIAFNKAHYREEMPFFQQELMEQAQAKGGLNDKPYLEALKNNHKLTAKEGIDFLLTKHKLDAIIAPTAGPAFTTDLVNGDHVDSGCASPPAVSGYPHITVPAGHQFGLPVGISFFASAWSEPKLIACAHAFEQLRKGRRAPQFRATADYDA